MAITLANGTTISIASGYGADVTISAVTNADPGVATAAAHGFADGDYIDVVSGWVNLNDRIVRVDGATTGTFELEEVDTTSTTLFPPGGGTGTCRKITGWTQLTQVLNSTSSGGEQQFWTGQFLEGDREIRIPTTKSASGLEFQIADDPAQPGYQLAKQANDDRLPRAVLVTLANGQKLLYKAYISLSLIPSLNVNEPMTNQVTLSLLGLPVRYAS
jgi:hypothetical protein